MRRVPVLIINEGILFPGNEFRFETNKKIEQDILTKADESPLKEVIIIHSLDGESTEDITQFPSIGVSSTVMLRLMIPNSKMRAVVVGSKRVKIERYELVDQVYYADVVDTSFPLDKDKEAVYVDMLFRSYQKYIHEISTVGNAMLNEFSMIEQLDVLTDIIVSMLPLKEEKKKKYLYEENATKRAEALMEQLKEEIAIAKLEREIDSKVQRELDEEQKSFYLHHKMRVIAEELGDISSKTKEVETLKKKVKNLHCSASIKARIKEEIMRYESVNQNSPEVTMMRDYIDWMINLPWDYKTKEVTALKEIEKVLDENHYGMKDVKERILEYIAVKQNSKHERSPILCLIGPPGVGKTSLAYSIAKSLNRRLATISVGGVNDEAEIVGHRRTYIGALPGRIIQGIKKAGSSNPVFVIDEIDKMSKDIKGDPASSLLEVLDKEQNSHFSDHYIEEPYDLSKVMFIATANYEEQIPSELKDRLEVIYIPSYTEYEKVDIAENHLLPRALEEHGLTSLQVQFTKEAMLAIIRYYTKEAGVRDLERMIAKILRKIVRKIFLEEQGTFFLVTPSLVETYLGKKVYTLHDTKEAKLVGVVNGLAYTPFGGDILPIEVTLYEGTGNLYLTGSLGEVMQESAQIALSYIKANYKEFNMSKDVFKKDIHIHVPEGAVSKEGPSAGIALTTAIFSAFSKTKVSTKIAMTGEITLQGRVLAIGGLREKTIGAYRAGIKTIYLPIENERDIEELPTEIKEGIDMVFVSDYKDIVKALFNTKIEVKS